MARRNFSSTAQRTTLSAGCTDVATTMTVTAVTGWPASTPYVLIIDPDTVNEEIVLVTNRASLTLTVTRAQGGTTGVAHSSGTVVQHGVYAQDFEDPNAFLNNAAAAPGPIQFSAGAVGAPAITTSGDSNTGIYFSAADTVDIATGGVNRVKIDATGVALGTGMELITQAGAVGTPAIYPTGDPNTGIYFSAADTVDIATGGVQRMSINSAGRISGTGTSLGSWASYTPTISGTGWALGNGTTACTYTQIGKVVNFRIAVTFGTTSTYGAGQLEISAPTSGASGITQWRCGRGVAYNGTNYPVSAATSAAGLFYITHDVSPVANVTSAVPFAWTNGNSIQVTGCYEAA